MAQEESKIDFTRTEEEINIDLPAEEEEDVASGIEMENVKLTAQEEEEIIERLLSGSRGRNTRLDDEDDEIPLPRIFGNREDNDKEEVSEIGKLTISSDSGLKQQDDVQAEPQQGNPTESSDDNTDVIAHVMKYDVAVDNSESNDSDDYERNRVRHHQLEKMSEADRRQLLAEMEADNVHLSHLQRQADAFLASWDGRLQPLLSHAQNAYILQHWVRTRCGITLSHSAQRDLLRRLRSDKPQWTQPLDDRWQLKKEYARVVLDTLEMCGFSYTYDTLCYVQTDHFSLCPQGKRIEGVTLKESDFPITIRNARSGDAIVLRFGTKKLSRWFIDRHIPQDVRRRWPVMVNAQGTVIFVPKIGCDITHFSNNPNVFMIQ